MARVAAPFAVFAALIAGTGGCKKSQGDEREAEVEAEAEPEARPELDLVLLVVIDQWPSWSFSRDVDVLEGGLARLVREGVYFAEAEYPFASTFTAPGHATIGSGAPPSRSGILANGWFRRGRDGYIPSTSDRDYPVFDIAAIQAGKKRAVVSGSGASPRALLVDGVADQLRRERPESKVVTVGLKERAAVLMVGRKPHLPVWYDDDQVAMTTGRFWTDSPPDWLIDLNREKPVAARLTTRWKIDDVEFVAEHTGGPDDQRGEAEVWGFDRTFPHHLADEKDGPKAMRVTPQGTALVFDTAAAALTGERLGQRGVTDLLALTVSSHDYAGHLWGQSSWERFDALRQIDRQLGDFLAHLDATVGSDRYAVVVTSDHGAVPLIERSVAAGREARRIPYEELLRAANQGASAVLGPGKWVTGYAANSIYLSDEVAPARRARAVAAAIEAIQKIPQIDLAAARETLAGGDCGRHTRPVERLVCESAHPERSGDILLVPSRYSLFIEARFPTGTAHGTPSAEDRHVPLIIRRPGVKPRRPNQRPSMLSVAPTLSELLGISPPPAASAEPVEL